MFSFCIIMMNFSLVESFSKLSLLVKIVFLNYDITEVECHRMRFVRFMMPRMKLVIPEMDIAPKAGQKREITCNY